jgi:hypothetical protein
MAADASSFEKLGVFYLGRPYESGEGAAAGSPFLYDSRDLTTHGLIVGMTGSGKTGLSIVLLEEAALDGIPAIVIDPKGDMGNLALQFPELSAPDFLPWIEPSEAEAQGKTAEELAGETAARWESGLTEWGQSKARIRSLMDAAEVSIYTPGSTSGRPIAALRSFSAPPEAVRSDEDALRERVSNAVSGLLGLVGIEADPVTSREHVLLASLLDRAWRASEDATLESLLQAVTTPPFRQARRSRPRVLLSGKGAIRARGEAQRSPRLAGVRGVAGRRAAPCLPAALHERGEAPALHLLDRAPR